MTIHADWLTQAFPALYKWTTFPLTALLEEVYKRTPDLFKEKKYTHALMVDFCSVLERALNYMHTGNTAVIATSVMNPMWIGRALLKDGFPCLNSNIVQIISSKHIVIDGRQWPYNDKLHRPHTSSKRAQLLTYGEGHFNVSYICIVFPVPRGAAHHESRIGGTDGVGSTCQDGDRVVTPTDTSQTLDPWETLPVWLRLAMRVAVLT